jgi:hypothetical protein
VSIACVVFFFISDFIGLAAPERFYLRVSKGFSLRQQKPCLLMCRLRIVFIGLDFISLQ